MTWQASPEELSLRSAVIPEFWDRVRVADDLCLAASESPRLAREMPDKAYIFGSRWRALAYLTRQNRGASPNTLPPQMIIRNRWAVGMVDATLTPQRERLSLPEAISQPGASQVTLWAGGRENRTVAAYREVLDTFIAERRAALGSVAASHQMWAVRDAGVSLPEGPLWAAIPPGDENKIGAFRQVGFQVVTSVGCRVDGDNPWRYLYLPPPQPAVA